jgi:hypothetical protein
VSEAAEVIEPSPEAAAEVTEPSSTPAAKVDKPSAGAMSPEERQVATMAMTAEQSVLMMALGGVWSASLVRTSVFLGVLSAAGLALGFASQAGVERTDFVILTVVVLLGVLFLGVTTFVRLVQLQREAVVYIAGQNRIRHFFVESAPTIGRYFILPTHDDPPAMYRSVGTGMNRRPPRYPLLNMIAQTQGIVGVITGGVAGVIAGLAVVWAGPLVSWLVAAGALLLTVAALFAYWQRSLSEIQAAIRPLSSTPSDELGAPF